MGRRLYRLAGRGHDASTGAPAASTLGGSSMQWTTPTATDVRLGFEITMYVAAR